MTTILAIEAATHCCSVALLHGDSVLERSHAVPREHARVMLPFIDELLAEAGLQLAQVDALAVGRGPGSFTGVRAAIATVQGLALGSDLPIVAQSTLRVLAASAERKLGLACCMTLLDARMNEVYAAAFEHGADVQAEHLVKPDQLQAPAGWSAREDWRVVGSGLNYQERLPADLRLKAHPDAGDLSPAARDLAELALPVLAAGQALQDPALLQPVYLRDQVVHQRN